MKDTDFTHLDAVQGKAEQRNEPYTMIRRMSSGSFDDEMRQKREILLILHDIRSIHNVGSIFRTAEGFGVKKIYLSGYTPSPDNGLPHVRKKIADQLHKTALGAEKMVQNEYSNDVIELIKNLKKSNNKIIGLEQDPRAIKLPDLRKGSTLTQNQKIALLLGEEVHGISPELRDLCDGLVEIPMFGKKESFNISVATGIALYELTLQQPDFRQ